MWKRKEIKAKAKAHLKANYWRSVLVAWLLAIVLAVSIGAGSSAVTAGTTGKLTDQLSDASETQDASAAVADVIDSFGSELTADDESINSLLTEVESSVEGSLSDSSVKAAVITIAAALGIFCIALICIAIILRVFVLNPIGVGCYRFFLNGAREGGQVGDVGYAFDHGFKSCAKVMFLKDLKLALWTLLFIIPGIIKYYEYILLPYILTDHPGISSKEAFALSRKMMKGNKWRRFVIHLSFIGWDLLSGCTLGILNFFYVSPYKAMTAAQFYETLRTLNEEPAIEA